MCFEQYWWRRRWWWWLLCHTRREMNCAMFEAIIGLTKGDTGKCHSLTQEGMNWGMCIEICCWWGLRCCLWMVLSMCSSFNCWVNYCYSSCCCYLRVWAINKSRKWLFMGQWNTLVCFQIYMYSIWACICFTCVYVCPLTPGVIKVLVFRKSKIALNERKLSRQIKPYYAHRSRFYE